MAANWKMPGRTGARAVLACVARVCVTLVVLRCSAFFCTGSAAQTRDLPLAIPGEQIPRSSTEEAEARTKQVLTSLQQVRQLSTAEATNAFPVRIRGVVTYYDPTWWNILFVQDATAGIYVNRVGENP